jgi:hypothetical protein
MFIGAKPVLIAMQDANGGTFQHLMTSRTFRGTTKAALAKGRSDARLLQKKGYDVSRLKIETTLTNPIAMHREEGGYFEAHIEIKFPKPKWKANWYFDVVDKVERVSPTLRLSNNPFKDHGDTVSYFVTTRETDPSWTPHLFNLHVETMVDGLSEYFEMGKVRSEFAWYDSNITLDNNWR